MVKLYCKFCEILTKIYASVGVVMLFVIAVAGTFRYGGAPVRGKPYARSQEACASPNESDVNRPASA